MGQTNGTLAAIIGFTPLIIAWLIHRYPGGFTPILGVLMFYAGGAALFLPFLGLAIAASLIGSGVIVLVFSGAVAVMERRIDGLAREARLSRMVLMRISHPEVPWPPLHPDDVVLEEWRGGERWRMTASGHWEFQAGKRWLPETAKARG